MENVPLEGLGVELVIWHSSQMKYFFFVPLSQSIAQCFPKCVHRTFVLLDVYRSYMKIRSLSQIRLGTAGLSEGKGILCLMEFQSVCDMLCVLWISKAEMDYAVFPKIDYL